MKSIYGRTFFALALAALPAIALAEDAFTMQQTDIYAGPSSDYPQIASLPPNTEVGVAGCLSDWSWCDVRFANDRGWIWAGDLGYPYEGRRVAIIEFGPRLHLPAVTFSINSYWDTHYRSRPFYRERNVYVSRVHVEGGHGGKAPHGGTRVASPSGGATLQGQAQVQDAQQQQRHEQGAQAEQRSREQAKAPTEQRSREQAQTEQQRSREQAQRAQPSPQANQATRPQEDMARSQQRPETSRSAQAEQRSEQGTRGMTQAQPQHQAQSQQDQHEARSAAQSKEGRGEAMHPQPDRGASANGPQNEASRAQPDRGASAKGPQGERPKEEGKESNQQ